MTTVEVAIRNEKTVIIDEQDLPLMEKYSWRAVQRAAKRHGKTYLYEDWVACIKVNKKTLYLHREITGAGEGMVVDHIDGNTLNNTRNNLRVCTHAQNRANSKRYSSNTAGFKGVSLVKKTGKFRACITLADIGTIYIGAYDTVEEAARAWDAVAKEWYGQYARLNFT